MRAGFGPPGKASYIKGMGFSEEEIQRYARHILLREVGGTGQARLKAAKVLIVGAGGLGSPLALYLAAAGVGTIGLVDGDVLELSNLQRQVAHSMDQLGEAKVTSAAEAMRRINPLVQLHLYNERLEAANVARLVAPYDIICDGTDNFATRFLLADACVAARRTLVSAAVLRFEGQLSTFKPHAHEGGPCYRCLYPEPPPEGLVPSCAQAGVLGAVTGVMGTLQATEVLKEIWNRALNVGLAADLGCAGRGVQENQAEEGSGMFRLRLMLALVGLLLCAAAPVGNGPGPALGVVTKLPVPRFVSLRTDQVNFRAGPGFQYPVTWVYQRDGLPVEIIGEFDVWRQVLAPDGGTGWVHEATIRAHRSFYITRARASLLAAPNAQAATVAYLDQGVAGTLIACDGVSDFCKVMAGTVTGYLAREDFWGVFPGEIVK